MHIGISRPPTPPHPLPDVDAAIVARIAEDLGFESIFYGEHPITPVGDPGQSVHSSGVPYFQDTLVALARASAVTTTIKIGSAVFLIPLHQAVMLAKQLATLDFYSGGRLILGFGLGWSRVECEVMGGNFERRWSQTRESLMLMKLLWTRDVVTFDGEFYKVPPVQLYPKPITKPWPPMLLPGPPLWGELEPLDSPKSLRAFERIVSSADGWMPGLTGTERINAGPALLETGRKVLNRLCDATGRDPKELQIMALLRTGVHDGDLRWPELVSREVLRHYEDVGVERVAVTVPTMTDEDHAREVLTRVAEAVL